MQKAVKFINVLFPMCVGVIPMYIHANFQEDIYTIYSRKVTNEEVEVFNQSSYAVFWSTNLSEGKLCMLAVYQ